MGIRERLSRLLAEAPAEAEAIERDEIWWTWGQMRQTAQAVTDVLEAAGLGEGARVGVVLENRSEHVAVVAALIASGRCTVTLSPLQPPARLAAHIARSRPPVVIAGTDALSGPGVLDAVCESGLALELRTDGTLHRAGGAARSAEGAAHAAEGSTHAAGGVAHTEGGVARAENAVPIVNPGVAVEMLTSGTTGAPKTVNLGFDQLDQALISGGQVPKADRLLSGSASLVSAPLVHIGGLWRALGCLATGRRMILMPKFVLDQWVSAVERHKLRAASLVPAALRTVLDAGVPADRIASLEVVTSGTAPCPKELADSFFRTYGIPVLMTYGATEFAGAVAGWTLPLHRQWWDSKAGSAGRALAGAELRITGDDGAQLPDGQSGRLEVRTAQTGQGAGNWVRTSDLARMDTDGFLWIEGRADDAIIRGGFKVQPETVQRALEKHAAVREAAVVSMPDERLGQVPVAAVEAASGRPAPEVAELIELCREHLLPYEVPVHIVVLDELPRTPSSKVSRVELLDLLRTRLADRTTT